MNIAPLTPTDVANIHRWPAYSDEFRALDYALRENGWLTQFPDGPLNHRYGAWVNSELVGFSILTQTSPGEAEFYIALHPGRTGQGLGKILTRLTLAKGFLELGFQRIHLKVRTWHTRGIRVYEQCGFQAVGEKELLINGEKDRFLLMENLNSGSADTSP